jgi:hypothetical protein
MLGEKDQKRFIELAKLMHKTIHTSPAVLKAMGKIREAGYEPIVELAIDITVQPTEPVDDSSGLTDKDLKDLFQIEEDDEI